MKIKRFQKRMNEEGICKRDQEVLINCYRGIIKDCFPSLSSRNEEGSAYSKALTQKGKLSIS